MSLTALCKSMYLEIETVRVYSSTASEQSTKLVDIFAIPNVVATNDKEIDKRAVEDASAFTNDFKNAMAATMSSITGIKERKD